jgi:hypothetical protein
VWPLAPNARVRPLHGNSTARQHARTERRRRSRPG